MVSTWKPDMSSMGHVKKNAWHPDAHRLNPHIKPISFLTSNLYTLNSLIGAIGILGPGYSDHCMEYSDPITPITGC
eukprot:2473005-Pyramimonas_sp.AAC.1